MVNWNAFSAGLDFLRLNPALLFDSRTRKHLKAYLGLGISLLERPRVSEMAIECRVMLSILLCWGSTAGKLRWLRF